MAFNGAGVFSVINTFVYDTVISETAMNANFSDVATGLSTCITRDGQSTVSANIPWNSNRITGLGDGTAAQDAAALHQIQDQDGIWCGTAGGTADALTLTPSPAITAYAAGQRFTFIGGASPNTGAATVAVSGLTTKAIQRNGAALAAADIATGKLYDIVYDGTQFQLDRISASAGLTSADIGETVQGYDADTTKNDVANTFTAEQTFSAGFDVPSSAAGDVLYHNGVTFTRLPIGTAGQALAVNSGATAPEWVDGGGATWTYATAQAASGLTALDFTGLPSDVTCIKILFDSLDTPSGGTRLLVQIGDSGGIETTGYSHKAWRSDSAFTAETGGFSFNVDTTVVTGEMVLTRLSPSADTWICNGGVGNISNNTVYLAFGSKTLSAALDRVRITNVSGLTTFDGGNVNICYSTGA